MDTSVSEVAALGMYAAACVLLVALLLSLSRFLGRRTRTLPKDEPFECGIRPGEPVRTGDRVPYYLVAVLFLIFDIEGVFIVSWALAFGELGVAGFAQIAFFIGVLFLALWYLVRTGALCWGPRAARRGCLAKETKP
jgi:NADH-quinone oxidoreductase subunit A